MPTTTSEMRSSFCGRLPAGVAELIARPGLYICEPPSLPEWRTISDDELLQ